MKLRDYPPTLARLYACLTSEDPADVAGAAAEVDAMRPVDAVLIVSGLFRRARSEGRPFAEIRDALATRGEVE